MAQYKDPEARKAYMHEYYLRNKEKFRPKTPEHRARYNENRNAKYKGCAVTREATRAKVKEWQRLNPEKRKAQRIKKYGLTLDQFNDMRRSQGDKCAICASAVEKFHIDHCHATGVVRGLLCESCNMGIGKFYDNPEWLESAARYVREKKSSD